MGPHSSEQGNLASEERTTTLRHASMGPHSSEQGNSPSGIESNLRSEGFNGASLFRARKRESEGVGVTVRGTASMGPHSSEQGNEILSQSWSMTANASMGPHSSEQGNPTPPRLGAGSDMLQWGLTLPSKETPALVDYSGLTRSASMGPHSSEQGNFCCLGVACDLYDASMGPHSSEQGNPVRLG